MFKCYFSRNITNILSYFILLSFYSRITFKKFSINGRASMTKYGQKLSYLNAIEGWLKPTPELLSSQSMEIMMGLMDLGKNIIENTIKKDAILRFQYTLSKNYNIFIFFILLESGWMGLITQCAIKKLKILKPW